MPKNPADDLPAQSVQDSPLKHTGATCPSDGTLVTCGGPRDAQYLQGICPVCKRMVYADATLVSQTGFLDAPHESRLDSPPKESKGDDNAGA